MDKKWGIKIEKLRLSGEKRSKRGEMVKKNGENKQRWVILRLSGDKREGGAYHMSNATAAFLLPRPHKITQIFHFVGFFILLPNASLPSKQ